MVMGIFTPKPEGFNEINPIYFTNGEKACIRVCLITVFYFLKQNIKKICLTIKNCFIFFIFDF